MREENVELAFRGLNRRDFEAFLALMDEDVEVVAPRRSRGSALGLLVPRMGHLLAQNGST